VHAVAYIFAVRLLALLKYIMNEVARRARNGIASLGGGRDSFGEPIGENGPSSMVHAGKRRPNTCPGHVRCGVNVIVSTHLRRANER